MKYRRRSSVNSNGLRLKAIQSFSQILCRRWAYPLIGPSMRSTGLMRISSWCVSNLSLQFWSVLTSKSARRRRETKMSRRSSTWNRPQSLTMLVALSVLCMLCSIMIRLFWTQRVSCRSTMICVSSRHLLNEPPILRTIRGSRKSIKKLLIRVRVSKLTSRIK